MQTFFTTTSRSLKGRPTTHQPSGGAFTSTPGEFIGGHARTQDERMAALARIKSMSAADFARRDQEIKNSKRKGKEQKKKDTDIGAAWLREHAPRVPKKAAQTEIDPLDAAEENIVDIDDIDVDAIDTDGGVRGYGYEDEDADDAGYETDVDEPAAIDDLISRRESRARADRWNRPALGFENGVPLGIGTADICARGQDRTKSKPEMTRANEARDFQRIRQSSYPTDGYDYKALCYLCDPSLSKKQIGDKLGRDPRAIRYAAKRIRQQFAAGKFRTRRGAGAAGIDMNDRAEVGAWLTQPLPVAKCGRKKGTTKTPKKIRIRIPARLRLAPLVAVVSASAPRPYKPRRPRTRWVDPAQVDMFAFDMAA